MKESIEMQTDPSYMLLEGAEGTIQQTEIQDTEVVNELTKDVSVGAFNYAITGTVPCKCIDGRLCSEHATEGANAAGGTETIFVGDDLTTKRFALEDGSVAAGMRKLIENLQSKGLEVGGHSDNRHENPSDSGCGANDRLPKIYDMITRKGDLIKNYAETILETAIDEATHSLIIGNAGGRNDFSTGGEVLSVLNEMNSSVEELEGTHKEVIAVINLRPGTTLSRQLLKEKYGEEYQVFNVDAWAFQAAAEATSESAEEAMQKVIAMTYYNLATALVLCGPNMRIVIVR